LALAIYGEIEAAIGDAGLGGEGEQLGRFSIAASLTELLTWLEESNINTIIAKCLVYAPILEVLEFLND
jgi:hypothetical protein